MSTGFDTLAAAGRNDRSSARVCALNRRELETIGFTGIGCENARAARVRENRHSRASRDGLMGEECGDIEQPFQRAGSDHARLGEQGVDDGIARRQGARVTRRRGRRRASGRTSPGRVARDDAHPVERAFETGSAPHGQRDTNGAVPRR